MPAAILPAVLLAGAAALTAADAGALDRTVLAIYRPYNHANNPTESWEYPIYSAETAALIARWQRVVPRDEPDDLNDGDWLCLCQDWDAKSFRVTVTSRALQRPGVAQVSVRIALGTSEARDARLIFALQGAAWKLDDIFASDFPRGLKQALRETIIKDQKH